MKYTNSQNFVLLTEFLTLVWNLPLRAMLVIAYISVKPSINSNSSSTRSGLSFSVWGCEFKTQERQSEHTDANSGIVLSGLVTHNLQDVLNSYHTDSSTLPFLLPSLLLPIAAQNALSAQFSIGSFSSAVSLYAQFVFWGFCSPVVLLWEFLLMCLSPSSGWEMLSAALC